MYGDEIIFEVLRNRDVNMKTMTVAEFKAHALQAVAEVSHSREPLVLIKHGHPLVQVVPYREPEMETVPGKLTHLYAFETDIVSPVGVDMWEAAK
jgi:antitoxin (DNA-binding transcriptional repressor) of toxin-antitoxin stability system